MSRKKVQMGGEGPTHKIKLHAIDIHMNRFLTTQNHIENRTFIAPTSPQHLQVLLMKNMIYAIVVMDVINL